MPKICYFIPSLHPGGAEFQTVNQLNKLYSDGIDVSIIILTNQVQLIDQLNIPKDRIHILNIENITPFGAKSFPQIPNALRSLDKVLTSLQPNVVLSILPICHLLCRLNKIFTGKKYSLWCYHRSMQFEANPNNTLFKKLFHQGTKVLSGKYDAGHIFISKAVEDNVSENMTIKNGHVIHNAIPRKKLDQSQALIHMNANGIIKSDYIVVIPGRLHSTKGHSFFINSVQHYILKKDIDKLKVIIVGGGELHEKLQSEIQERGLSDRIHITGFVDNELLLSYLELADLVCIPSIHEGFGNVAVEALMQGSTILASNTGGLPEIINDNVNGFLFERANSQDLYQKLTDVIENKKSLDPDVLIKDYENRFTLEAQVKKILNTIQS